MVLFHSRFDSQPGTHEGCCFVFQLFCYSAQGRFVIVFDSRLHPKRVFVCLVCFSSQAQGCCVWFVKWTKPMGVHLFYLGQSPTKSIRARLVISWAEAHATYMSVFGYLTRIGCQPPRCGGAVIICLLLLQMLALMNFIG